MRPNATPERVATSLPSGTRARIAAVITEHCQPESAFVRVAVLEHLKRVETARDDGRQTAEMEVRTS